MVVNDSLSKFAFMCSPWTMAGHLENSTPVHSTVILTTFYDLLSNLIFLNSFIFLIIQMNTFACIALNVQQGELLPDIQPADPPCLPPLKI